MAHDWTDLFIVHVLVWLLIFGAVHLAIVGVGMLFKGDREVDNITSTISVEAKEIEDERH